MRTKTMNGSMVVTTNPGDFENFDNPTYRDQDAFRKRWKTTWGDPNDIVLDAEVVGEGKHSMKWTYNYQGGYACHRSLYGFGPDQEPFPTPVSQPESEYVAWSFWVKGDGSQNWLYLGVLTLDNGESWMCDYAVSLASTQPQRVVVPFSKFVIWDHIGPCGDGKFASAGFREIWYGVRGPAPSKGTIHLGKMSFLTRAEYLADQSIDQTVNLEQQKTYGLLTRIAYRIWHRVDLKHQRQVFLSRAQYAANPSMDHEVRMQFERENQKWQKTYGLLSRLDLKVREMVKGLQSGRSAPLPTPDKLAPTAGEPA